MIPDIKNASFAHKASSYIVETRARVIMFDIAAFEADAALSRRSSALLPHAVDHPHRSLGREHSGLMSWPENFFQPTQHKQNSEGVKRKTNSLSERAMQLSIYGSMVCWYMLLISASCMRNFFSRLLSQSSSYFIEQFSILLVVSII